MKRPLDWLVIGSWLLILTFCLAFFFVLFRLVEWVAS
jgi:hypothetical protein